MRAVSVGQGELIGMLALRRRGVTKTESHESCAVRAGSTGGTRPVAPGCPEFCCAGGCVNGGGGGACAGRAIAATVLPPPTRGAGAVGFVGGVRRGAGGRCCGAGGRVDKDAWIAARRFASCSCAPALASTAPTPTGQGKQWSRDQTPSHVWPHTTHMYPPPHSNGQETRHPLTCGLI